MMPSNCEREIRVFMVQEKAQVEGGYDYSEEDPGHATRTGEGYGSDEEHMSRGNQDR